MAPFPISATLRRGPIVVDVLGGFLVFLAGVLAQPMVPCHSAGAAAGIRDAPGASGQMARVRGVVCFYNHLSKELFLQDDNHPLLVTLGQRPDFEPGVGQLLEAEGDMVPAAGGRRLDSRIVRLLGEAPLPSPLHATYSQMANGKVDCRYSQFDGIVRAVGKARPDGLLPLMLADDGGRVTALLRDYHLGDCRKLVDAEVQVTGVCFREFTPSGALHEITLRVSGMGGIAVVKPAPAEPFSATSHPIAQLAKARLNSPHRVKVSGVVSFQQPGTCVFLEDDSGGLRIETTQPLLLRSGDRVEALGFAESTKTGAPTMLDATLRRFGRGPAPPPLRATPEELRSGRQFWRLVEFDAVVVEPLKPADQAFHLHHQGIPLTAHLASEAGRFDRRIPVGVNVRVVGLYSGPEGQGIGVLVRSSREIVRLGGRPHLTQLWLWLAAVLVATGVGLLWLHKRRRTSPDSPLRTSL